jgi:hypothetical protein
MESHAVIKSYQELADVNKLVEVINEYIVEFNAFYPKQQINLVLFDDAIQFLCKVNRILS